MRFAVVTGVVALGVVLTACADDEATWVLPDRDDPAVQAEEARLADVVERSGVVWDTFGQMSCEVRLLGSEPGAAFAWAVCGVDLPTGGRSGLSVPLRIEGDVVIEPVDGQGHGDSVHEMFPDGLADLVLGDQEAVRP